MIFWVLAFSMTMAASVYDKHMPQGPSIRQTQLPATNTPKQAPLCTQARDVLQAKLIIAPTKLSSHRASQPNDHIEQTQKTKCYIRSFPKGCRSQYDGNTETEPTKDHTDKQPQKKSKASSLS